MSSNMFKSDILFQVELFSLLMFMSTSITVKLRQNAKKDLFIISKAIRIKIPLLLVSVHFKSTRWSIWNTTGLYRELRNLRKFKNVIAQQLKYPFITFTNLCLLKHLDIRCGDFQHHERKWYKTPFCACRPFTYGVKIILTRVSLEGQWTSLWMLMRDWPVCRVYGKQLTCRTRRFMASRTSWQFTTRSAKPCSSPWHTEPDKALEREWDKVFETCNRYPRFLCTSYRSC